jgi:hypothetical protein
MSMIGFPFPILTSCVIFIAGWFIPIILGFTVIRADANTHGQPGWLWAVLTIPFGWLTLLVYAVIRAVISAPRV